jgi:hypothetical protein
MVNDLELIRMIDDLLRMNGIHGELQGGDLLRIRAFLERLRKGYMPVIAPHSKSDDLTAWILSMKAELEVAGDGMTVLAVIMCIVTAFLVHPKDFNKAIETVGDAARKILDSTAGRELLALLKTYVQGSMPPGASSDETNQLPPASGSRTDGRSQLRGGPSEGGLPPAGGAAPGEGNETPGDTSNGE